MAEAPEYLDSVGRLIGFAYRSMSAVTSAHLAEHDLTTPQWILLSALWRQDGLSVTALSKYTKSSLAATSKLVDRMARQDLVERRPDPEDRRQVRVWLRPRAKKKRELLGVYEVVNDQILDGFSEAERNRVRRYLERIIANATKAYEAHRSDDPLVMD